MKATPTARAWRQRTQFATILIVLVLAALLAPRCQSAHTVTISGVQLGVTQAELRERFGEPSFQLGSPPHHLEYWAFKSESLQNDLQLELSDRGAYQIRGGDPQIDGRSVKDWSPDDVMVALGTPDKVASSKSLCPEHSGTCSPDCSYSRYTEVVLGRNTDQVSLSYSRLNLLVNWSRKNGIEFVLFTRP